MTMQGVKLSSEHAGTVTGIASARSKVAAVQPRNIFGPDSVHAQHLLMICSVGCSTILPVAICTLGEQRSTIYRQCGVGRGGGQEVDTWTV